MWFTPSNEGYRLSKQVAPKIRRIRRTALEILGIGSLRIAQRSLFNNRAKYRTSQEKTTVHCPISAECGSASRLQEVGDEGVLQSDGLDAYAVGVPEGPVPGATARPLDLEGPQATVLLYDQIHFRLGA